MPVGYVYDPIYLEHDTGEHPECPERLEMILARLGEAGLLQRLTAIPAEAARVKDLARVHAPSLIQRIRELAERGGGYIDSDTVVSARSYDVALYAAGGAIAATRAVLDGEVRSAYLLARPPGHHATRAQAMGFCLFNNIAIAASWVLAEEKVSRLAIVDFDVHHGNGTADTFDTDPRVLFISLHQYPFYPGTGHWREMGSGPGLGTTLNISLPPYTGDNGYGRIFERLVAPALRRYQPELILVSAGYDGHWGDPLAWMLLSISGYRRMADALVGLADELCDGRLVFVLEGGYQGPALAHGVATTISAMLGEPYEDVLGASREPETPVEPLLRTIAAHHGLISTD